MSVHYKGKYYNTSLVGLKLKKIRKQANLNLDDVHEASSFAKSKISYLENGKIKRPKIEDLLIILNILKVDIDDFFTEDMEEVSTDDNKYLEFMLYLKLKMSANELEDLNEEFEYFKNKIDLDNDRMAYIHKMYGDFNYLKGDYKKSLSAYEESIKKYEEYSNYNLNYYLAYSMRNNALYKLNKLGLAKIKNIQLLQLLTNIIVTVPEDELYERLYFCVQLNLVLCLIGLYDIEKALALLVKLEPVVHDFEPNLVGHYYLLISNIYYYNGEWNYFKKSFMETLFIMNKCKEQDLINKTLLGVYILAVSHFTEVDLAFIHQDEKYSYIKKCTPTCKKNPTFHRTCHGIVIQLINNKQYAQAKEFLVSVIENGHVNSMTHLLAYRLNALAKFNISHKNINHVMLEIEYDTELLSHEKLYIYSSFAEVNNKERPQSIQNLVEEVYLSINNSILNNFLPEPLS